MKIELGHGVYIDLKRLVKSRLLLQANSGGGKSWTLRRILEQTHGHVQQIVIDPEDEFYTLREKYDYILVRHDGGDCVPEIRSADLLARRLLELGVSAIISIYELSPRDRREFVKRFLNALINAPKKLWHPALVVLDEAHDFAPEHGRGKDQSGGCSDAVIGLMSKGRKRGFCGILATQRISKLSKDAAAEANNKIVGRATIDIDRKRAAEELGLTSKDDILSLRQLNPEKGEAFVFGPAISDDVRKINVGGVETTHPEAGGGAVPIAPPKTKVKSVLAQLADLPQEAAEEQATLTDLQRQVRELKTKLAQSEKAQPKTETKVVEKPVFKDSQIKRIEEVAKRMYAEAERHGKAMALLWKNFDEVAGAFTKAIFAVAALRQSGSADHKPVTMRAPEKFAPARTTTPARQEARSPRNNDGAPTGGLRRIMISLAQRPNGLTQRQIGVFAGLSSKGGTFSTYISRARSNAWIEGDRNLVRITPAGIEALGNFELLPTGELLYQYWLAKLGNSGAARILQALHDTYPNALSKEEVGDRAQISTTGGSFSTYLSRLRSLELIEGTRELKASDELFD